MSDRADIQSPAKVLIVGGGVGAVEALLALKDLAADRVEMEIFAPRRDFVYKPFSVGEPYGAAEVLRFDLQRVAEDCGADYAWESIASVDTSHREAVTQDGRVIVYDYLILSPGVKLIWPYPGATTFWGTSDEADIEYVIRELEGGRFRRVAFTLPGGCSWSLPLYELALLTGARLKKVGINGVQLMIVTPEESPLGAFGRQASADVAELLAERGIEVITGAHPVKFELGELTVAPGGVIEADAVVSLPRLEGRQIDGIPHDQAGFIPTDDFGAIQNAEGAYAIGDVTTFPVKQGGIATQQADTVAEAIAADLGYGGEPEPFDPILRGVLWTGGQPRYLYGALAGGHGETSSMSEDSPWPEHGAKIIGRYITPYMAQAVESANHSV